MNGIKNDGPEEQALEEEVETKLQKVLMHCMKHNESWPFVEPVEEKYAPGYFDKIRTPMNLLEMENKLNNHKYTSKEEFVADMDLIVENCRQYNGEDSDFALMARNLRNAFHRSLRRMFPVVRVKKDDDEDFIINGKDAGVSRKYRVKRDASRRASESFPELLSEEHDEIVTQYNDELVTYRPVGFNRRRYSHCIKPESIDSSPASSSMLQGDQISDFKGYERRQSSTAESSVSPGTRVMDSMIQSGTRRQVITSTRPSKYLYSPGDQVFNYCQGKKQLGNWKDLPPVLHPEAPISQEKSSTGAPLPTWSYRRDTLPQEVDEGPPKLRRMVPSPVSVKLREQELVKAKDGSKSGFVPISLPCGPPVLEPQAPVVSSMGGVTQVMGGVTQVTSTIHQSGGTIRAIQPTAVAGTPVVKPAPRVMRISKEDYLRLLAENKIKIVQSAPGGQGQVVKLQAGMQIRPKLASAGHTTTATTTTVTSSAGSVATLSGAFGSATKSSCSLTSPVVSASATSIGSTMFSSSVPFEGPKNSCASSLASSTVSQAPPVLPTSSSSVHMSAIAPVACAAAPPVPLSHETAVTVSSVTPISSSHSTPLRTHKGVSSEEKESRDLQTSPLSSQDQTVCSGRHGRPLGSTKKGRGSKRKSSLSGHNDFDKSDDVHDEESDITLAQLSDPSGVEDNSDICDMQQNTKPKVQTGAAGGGNQTSITKLNLKGLSSQLASAMSKKRDHSSSESGASLPKRRHRVDWSSVSSTSSVPIDLPPPLLDQENVTIKDPCLDSGADFNVSTNEQDEAFQMDLEEDRGPPELESFAESESGKGSSFGSVSSQPSAVDDGSSKNVELTSSRFSSPGVKISMPGSGSKMGKSPRKHADSNIFQRMMDFTSGSSPEKSSNEDQIL